MNSSNAGHKPAVLVLGQTPPPYGGQAMVIDSIVKADFHRISVYHVRMAFSPSMQSMGRVHLAKVAHLFWIVARSLWIRFRHGVRVLYYPPAGPNWAPVARDAILLTAIRPFFDKTVFHFEAAGVSEFLRTKRGLLRGLALHAYSSPSGAIQVSALNPADPEYFGAGKTRIIPNGLKDAAMAVVPTQTAPGDRVTILFVGIVSESKGVGVLLDAARLLKERGIAARILIVGEFASNGFRARAREYCRANRLDENVEFLGERTGADKWKCFQQADIFCFPTYFESESFGNVVLEAMMFRLPVVATNWRGVPGIVEDGGTGLLVPIKDSARLAEALATLIDDPELRRQMGARGRERYLKEFTLQKHLDEVEKFLHEIATAE